MENSLIVTICIQILGLGIFIGMTRAFIMNITNRLQRIEDKQDKNNQEMVELRERVAVIESVLEIKKR